MAGLGVRLYFVIDNSLRFGLDVSPRTTIDRLSSGEQQMVEIIRSLNSNSWVVVMDEPTSALSEIDKERLFSFVKQMTIENVAVIYITHHMPEIFRVADEVTVIRDGKVVDTIPTKETTEGEIVRMMVGTQTKKSLIRSRDRMGEIAMEVSGLTRYRMFENANFAHGVEKS